MALNLCDDNRSLCVSHCVLNEVLKYCLVFVYFPYLFIDASTGGYEEEGDYEEEEEEPCTNCTNCANCTNQGKLIPMQALLVQK